MTTQHNCGGPVFGRLTKGCPRCDELAAGASAIRWRKRSPGPTLQEIRAHDCRRSNCGPVCTAFDW